MADGEGEAGEARRPEGGTATQRRAWTPRAVCPSSPPPRKLALSPNTFETHVLCRFDEDKGRWKVKLCAGGELGVKPANLEVRPSRMMMMIVLFIVLSRNKLRKTMPVPTI